MRNIITIIALAVVCSLSAQTNVVQEGYYEMIDSTGNVFDTKESEKEVIQAIYNYYINTGKKATYRSPKIRVDFDNDFFTVHSDTVFIATEQIEIVNTILIDSIEHPVDNFTFFNENTIDTLTVTPCFEDYGAKIWYHVGDVNTYPHRIYFPTKELEFIGIMFSDSLTTEEKTYKTEFIIERNRNRMSGNTSYRYLSE